MSLTTLNIQAVTHLQGGRADEGVSLLLEAFDRLDLLNGNHTDDDGCEEQRDEEEVSLERSDVTTNSDNNSASTTSKSQTRSSLSGRYSMGSGQSHSYMKRAPSPRGASTSSSDGASRYQAAINRATEAHLRLAQSLGSSSLEATTTNINHDNEPPVLDSVGSDVSALSEDSGCDSNASGGEEDDEGAAAVLPSRSNVSGEEEDEDIPPDESQDESDTSSLAAPFAGQSASLQSVALPKFHDATTSEEDLALQPVSDNIFTFYQRAFVLTIDDGEEEAEPTASAQEEEDSYCCPKQSAVLLYNMAVAHHNYAMSSWSSSTRNNNDRVASHREFRTALVFYDMCFNIIQDSWADDEDFLLLLLAVWNNMGHIHAHRYNYLETQEMLASLQEILQVICSSPPLLETMNDDFLFFYKNLVVYEEQEFAAAPAA